jgi:hypothetical protein
MSPVKETNFFAYEGKDTYENWLGPRSRPAFPVTNLSEYAQLFADHAGEAVRGEASPLYLESPVAAANIRRQVPQAKLLVSLRNPVERAFSGFMMHVRRTRENEDVEAAFQADKHYVQVGFYYRQLARYYELFPREQLRVYIYEEFRDDPTGTMRDIFTYLGVEAEYAIDMSTKHNVGGYPRSKWLNQLLANPAIRNIFEPITPGWALRALRRLQDRNYGQPPPFPPALRARLQELYREDIRKLEDLLQRDLSSWLDG